MPDCIGADGKVVDGAILGDAPGISQIRHGQTAGIKSDQTSKQQPVDITVRSVVLVKQWIQATERTNQAFSINATLRRLRRKYLLSGFGDEQKHTHHHQGDNNYQDLPA